MKKVLLIPWTIALMLFCNTYLDALTFSTDIRQVGSAYIDYSNIANQNEWTATDSGYITRIRTSTNNQVQNKYIELINKLDTTTVDYVAIPFMASQPTRNLQTNLQVANVWCDTWYGITDSAGHQQFTCQNWNTEYSGNSYDPYTINLTSMNFYFTATYFDDNDNWDGWNSCDFSDGMILCPTERKKIKYIYVHYNFDAADITYANIYFGGGIRFYNYNDARTAIENQTQQQQQQYQEATNGTWTPNNNVNTNQNGANETLEYGQKEEQLMNEIEINESSLDNVLSSININTQASAFIWDIATGIRNMNPKLILLFTSILGLGIIKMVLNR